MANCSGNGNGKSWDHVRPYIQVNTGITGACVVLVAPIFIGFPNIQSSSPAYLQDIYELFLKNMAWAIFAGAVVGVLLQVLRDCCRSNEWTHGLVSVPAVILTIVPAIFGYYALMAVVDNLP